MTRRRESLQKSLTRQYVLLACVPLLMVVVLWSAVAIPQTLRDIEGENQRTAMLVRAQVELLIAAPREAAGRAATHVRPGASESEIRAALSAALAEAPSLESVTLVDAQGVVTFAEVRPGMRSVARDWEGLDLSQRPFYARARLADAPVWSDTFLSPLTGHITAVVSAPADGRLVVADLSLDKISQQLHLPGRAGELAVIVFDRLGRVIIHPQQQLASWQVNLSRADLVHRALAGYSGPGELTLDGHRWLASVAPASTTGWTVLVAQPRNMLFGPVERLAGVVGIAVLGALICVVAIALRLARRQARRYQRLVDAAAVLVDGAGQAPEVDLGSAEVHGLWVQLRRLLDRSKEQERAARRAQAELQAVLDAATEVAIIAVDGQHVVRLFNRGAEKMLGYRAGDMLDRLGPLGVHDEAELARRAQELTREFQRPIGARESLTAVAERFGHEVRDWTYVRSDGTRLSVSLAVTAVRAPLTDDTVAGGTGFLFVATDQSERVRAGELELARRRAEAASQAKSEFLSRVSHELRTPMNAMLGFAQLLQMEEVHRLDDFQRERVARIESAGWHLVHLINDVLDLSTIESGHARIVMADTDVGTVIQDSVRLLAPIARTAGVRLGVAPPTEVAWHARVDPTRLRQVLVNVIGNAIKYNVENGRVDIAVRSGLRDDGSLEIEIVDTGRGMTPAQLERLFSAFDRLGLESSAIEGTGIGLVISRQLIERMGGTIAVDSRPDVGTRVTLTLQRSTGSVDLPEGAPGDASVRRGGGGQIVYVEDNPINALLMQEVVAQRPRCTLHLAVGVADGIAMIARLRPDLVLVDLQLPDGSGLEVARWMRTQPAFASLPVVVVSADDTPLQQSAANGLGVRAFLAKPVNLVQALDLIDELLPTLP